MAGRTLSALTGRWRPSTSAPRGRLSKLDLPPKARHCPKGRGAVNRNRWPGILATCPLKGAMIHKKSAKSPREGERGSETTRDNQQHNPSSEANSRHIRRSPNSPILTCSQGVRGSNPLSSTGRFRKRPQKRDLKRDSIDSIRFLFCGLRR